MIQYCALLMELGDIQLTLFREAKKFLAVWSSKVLYVHAALLFPLVSATCAPFLTLLQHLNR